MFKLFSIRSRVYAGQTLGDGEGQRSLACCMDMGLQRVLPDCETEQQQKVWDTIRGPENLNHVNNAIRISADCWLELK